MERGFIALAEVLTLSDKMQCYDESIPNQQIPMENKAYILISVAYTFFLFLLLVINKFFVGRINRYVDILDRNPTAENVRNYTIGSHYLRLSGKLNRHVVYKILFFVILVSFVLSFIDPP